VGDYCRNKEHQIRQGNHFKKAVFNPLTTILSKRSVKHALAHRELICLAPMLAGSSASKSSTVVAPGNLVNTSRKYA